MYSGLVSDGVLLILLIVGTLPGSATKTTSRSLEEDSMETIERSMEHDR